MVKERILRIVVVIIMLAIVIVGIDSLLLRTESESIVSNISQDLAKISSSSQNYYDNPQLAGGGGHSFIGITFYDISFEGDIIDGQHAANQHADYTIPEHIVGTSFVITATMKDSARSELQARICPDSLIMGNINGGFPGQCP